LRTRTIAIVGGGPAGALAAHNLARAGRRVVLFDEKLAWEKPCGGGITHKALAQWPFLREAEVQRNWVRQCELIAPSGRRVCFTLPQPVAIFSRRVLNGLLLERARAAGAEIIRSRIRRIEGRPGAWQMEWSAGSLQAEYLVLAAGARNHFLADFALPLAPEDLMVTAGYYIPGHSDLMQIQFLSGLHGYFWLFPRADHFSAGICGKLGAQSTAQLRARLEQSLSELGLEFRRAQFYAHVLPSLRTSTLRENRISGAGWAVIGDAAGFVDPITGEGLYYAMRSGELLSQALLANQPDSYPGRVREDFLLELEMAASVAERFYSGSWMGEAVIERMVQFTRYSASFRTLMCELFTGSQGYVNLRPRLYRSLPAMLGESLVNSLRLPSRDAGLQADSSLSETT
jgi:geranylgeranyl diphosphate/geranylgeranyl-bacteriochlorophyllide a reductase